MAAQNNRPTTIAASCCARWNTRCRIERNRKARACCCGVYSDWTIFHAVCAVCGRDERSRSRMVRRGSHTDSHREIRVASHTSNQDNRPSDYVCTRIYASLCCPFKGILLRWWLLDAPPSIWLIIAPDLRQIDCNSVYFAVAVCVCVSWLNWPYIGGANRITKCTLSVAVARLIDDRDLMPSYPRDKWSEIVWVFRSKCL